MVNRDLIGGQELLCVNVDKVYDWILNQSSFNLAGPAVVFPVTVPCGAGIQISSVTCDITQVSATEIGTRTNRTFVINGAEVTLQRVNIEKVVEIVVTVVGVTLATGVPFTIVSTPFTQTISESFFLCAPEGTEVHVTITDVECAVGSHCTAAGAFVVDNINALICQSIQVTAPVTIELTASFCAPRENIIAACPAPTVPPQCPVLFPSV